MSMLTDKYKNHNYSQKIYTNIGTLYITHPQISDVPDLISLLKTENLDLRRLEVTSHESHPSLGRNQIFSLWKKYLDSTNSNKEVVIQAKGILSHKNIPQKGTLITDAFRMKKIETQKPILELQKSQLKNILILKNSTQIISCVRLLPVDKDWQIVSLITKSGFRKKGLASIVINQAFNQYKQRPLYSFLEIGLVTFYMHLYSKEKPTIPPFETLPAGLQHDLFYMNIFWGPHIIIRVN